MTVRFLSHKYYKAFDSDPRSRTLFAFSKWIELQGGTVRWSEKSEHDLTYFTFAKESDAIMFVLKWGEK